MKRAYLIQAFAKKTGRWLEDSREIAESEAQAKKQALAKWPRPSMVSIYAYPEGGPANSHLPNSAYGEFQGPGISPGE